jgi:hypothetical protein
MSDIRPANPNAQKMKKFLFVLLLTSTSIFSIAQQNMQSLKLDDLSAFKQQAGNWQIVGDVVMNPYVDIHPAHKETPDNSKKKKKSKDQNKTTLPQAVTFQPGNGILLNVNEASKKDQLVTNWEHGDIELEFDVMLPKGSNSGVYLQGRYEVQLFDSWGEKNPKFSDIGGIYRNWETEPGKIYMGKAPLSNPSKAPGLWQKMKISFRAPKFDTSGKKLQNARFVSVELNGVRIHDNVEVPLPTGGPIENNEKPTGPLVIQGDHGPVAFRNVKYRLMKDANFSFSNISYQTFYGNFKTIEDFASLKPVATGALEELSCEILEKENEYGSKYTAEVTVPEDGEYEFVFAFTGGGKLTVNNQELVNFQRPDGWRRDQGKITLKAGKYPVEIYNYKDASWMPPRLALYVQSANSYPKALHAFNSFPPDEDPTSPILINAGNSPRLLRAFVDFKGDRAQRLTHTIGVGNPSGVNFVYDLKSGNLVCVWRGDFVDATPMWHDRGDGSFKPRGAAQYLFTGQPLAVLGSENDAFPTMSSETDFRSKGYQLDESSGSPIFKYIYKAIEVQDKVYAGEDNKMITHEITLKSPLEKLYYKLAEGSSITAMPDGSYAIDDKQYYIKADANVKPVIREANGKKELITLVAGNSIKYSVIW